MGEGAGRVGSPGQTARATGPRRAGTPSDGVWAVAGTAVKTASTSTQADAVAGFSL
jgi:hypothetical protein